MSLDSDIVVSVVLIRVQHVLPNLGACSLLPMVTLMVLPPSPIRALRSTV